MGQGGCLLHTGLLLVGASASKTNFIPHGGIYKKDMRRLFESGHLL